MSQLMDMMLIEFSETRVETYSSDLYFVKNNIIYWTPDFLIYVWFFNRGINPSQYF